MESPTSRTNPGPTALTGISRQRRDTLRPDEVRELTDLEQAHDNLLEGVLVL